MCDVCLIICGVCSDFRVAGWSMRAMFVTRRRVTDTRWSSPTELSVDSAVKNR